MHWQIINHLNELLITRAFYAAGIKVSPPIETPNLLHPFAFRALSAVLLCRVLKLWMKSRDNRKQRVDIELPPDLCG